MGGWGGGNEPGNSSLDGPGTHAGSSPEGDAAFDEEHPHVAAADHEQHAAEAQVDEADEDLDRLRGAGGGSARRAGRAPHRPLPAAEESVAGPCALAANRRRLGNKLKIPFFYGDVIITTVKDSFKKESQQPTAFGTHPSVTMSARVCFWL